MKSFFTNQNGSGLIGILVAIVIIAALVYGGVFFSRNTDTTDKNTDTTEIESPAGAIKALNRAKQDIGGIQQNLAEKNQMIEDLIGDSEGMQTTAKDAEQTAPGEIDEWDTLTREDDGFSLRYPHGWYYTVNHAAARAVGNILVIGFAASSSVWEQEPPYDISLTLKDGERVYETDASGKYFSFTGNGMTAILTTERDELKNILKQMADSFKFIESKQEMDGEDTNQ